MEVGEVLVGGSWKRWLAAGLLVLVAAGWRIVNWHYGVAPNLEAVTATAMVAAVWLEWRYAVGVPLVAMAVSDAVIGNSPILLFTWSGFMMVGLMGLTLRRWRERPGRLIPGGLAAGVAGSVWFFLWTNFGVWLMSGMYAHSWQGLTRCYEMGIPFYRTMLLGNLVLVPMALAAGVYAPRTVQRWRREEVLSS